MRQNRWPFVLHAKSGHSRGRQSVNSIEVIATFGFLFALRCVGVDFN